MAYLRGSDRRAHTLPGAPAPEPRATGLRWFACVAACLLGPLPGAAQEGPETPEALDGGAPAPAPAEAAPDPVTTVPAPQPPPEPEPRPEPQRRAIDVAVRARKSEARELQESAEAVTVVDMKRARQQTADLGEVLARTQGVGVRRDGGLGSNTNISLNGLQGDQIRLFLDGVPLNLAGYPFGLVNIPVNLVERVEVYRGVVPLRFGADALGGAINVVSDQSYETHLGSSYQIGSFGTHRATVNGRYRHAPTGLVFGGAAFVDSAKNDFLMHDRELANDDGSTEIKTVKRFHDAYRAYGGNVELGVVDRAWAKRLLVQGYLSTYDKELQHNAVMTYPFGEARYGETIAGSTARYSVDLRPNLELEALANYSHRIVDFIDETRFAYTWDGKRAEPVGRNDELTGILPGGPTNKSTLEDTLFARLGLNWTVAPGHILRASATPSAVFRTGDDHITTRPDLLHLDQRVKQLVGGLQYDLSLFEDRLANEAFAKGYLFRASSEDRLAETGDITTRHRPFERFGGGDALRFRFNSWLLTKASYEYAIRLPRPDELFGNGVLIEGSVSRYRTYLLKPERSHNVNLGPRLELRRTPAGDFTLDINGFLRNSKDMIVLIAGATYIPYSNISDARTLGVESAGSWTSPGRWLTLEGSYTFQDVRNTSTSGPFEPQKGLRLPSRPWMFASFGGRLRFANLPGRDDALEPFYYGRYVHEFLRGWEISDPEFRTIVPKQISHAVGMTWSVARRYGKLATTFEISNVSNARLYDLFGVERPGRAYYLKLTGQL